MAHVAKRQFRGLGVDYEPGDEVDPACIRRAMHGRLVGEGEVTGKTLAEREAEKAEEGGETETTPDITPTPQDVPPAEGDQAADANLDSGKVTSLAEARAKGLQKAIADREGGSEKEEPEEEVEFNASPKLDEAVGGETKAEEKQEAEGKEEAALIPASRVKIAGKGAGWYDVLVDGEPRNDAALRKAAAEELYQQLTGAAPQE